MRIDDKLERLDFNRKSALLFDVDGTLAETQPAHCLAYKLAFEANDLFFDEEIFWDKCRFGGKVLMPALMPNADKTLINKVVEDKKKLLSFTLEKMIKPNKELIDLIKKSNKSYLIIIVSNGRRESVTKILRKLKIYNYVDYIVSSALKPNPNGYLKAMNHYLLKPDEVIAFEDNDTGINAAHRAGIGDIFEVINIE